MTTISFSLATCGASVDISNQNDLPQLQSLKAAEIINVLTPEFQPWLSGPIEKDTRLLEHFRSRFSHASPGYGAVVDETTLAAAEQAVRHEWTGNINQMDTDAAMLVPLDPVECWHSDPVGDIEWVARIHRFCWAKPLAQAFAASGDERFAGTWLDLVHHWIQSHRLECAMVQAHPHYPESVGFAWLDIQTGLRASVLAATVPMVIHSKHFTPAILLEVLASLYDHQIKTFTVPRPDPANKSFIELQGLLDIAELIPEFRSTPAWVGWAGKRLDDLLAAQLTASGVQKEWSFGYHKSVYNHASAVTGKLKQFNVPMSSYAQAALSSMAAYIELTKAPDGTHPHFGDSGGRTSLIAPQTDAPAMQAETSVCFPDAGMTALRSDDSLNAIYLALHCPPPQIHQINYKTRHARFHGHDEADNNTFELYAFGRWLMTDTGFYVYPGHQERQTRQWHRQTANHQTLTVNGQDTYVEGRHLLWSTSNSADVVAVENQSYDNLVHRRTIWFVNKQFFVLLDEALGEIEGTLDLHFQFAPGDLAIDLTAHQAVTCYSDSNVMVRQDSDAPVEMTTTSGWTSEQYGQREPRPVIQFRHLAPEKPYFLTVVVPFHGQDYPKVLFHGPLNNLAETKVNFELSIHNRRWRFLRDIIRGQADAVPVID